MKTKPVQNKSKAESKTCSSAMDVDAWMKKQKQDRKNAKTEAWVKKQQQAWVKTKAQPPDLRIEQVHQPKIHSWM